MLILITGGAAGGKSAMAESVCETICRGSKVYIATMAVRDAESERRVKRHREMRQKKQFDTVECALCKDFEKSAPYDTALLECMSNLLANEMYIENKTAAEAQKSILDFMKKLRREIPRLVVVTNDIFGECKEFDRFTEAYIKALGDINKALAKEAHIVIESVFGIPVYVKGAHL